VVSCLLLSFAALCWPGPAARRRSPGGAAGALGLLTSAGSVAEGEGVRGRAPLRQKLSRPIVVVVGSSVLLLAFVIAGPAGLIAAAMLVGTTSLLIRQTVLERRHRAALVDILGALRILGRELQAGADPGLAAANGVAVTRGEGALVLVALAQLTHTEQRSANDGLANGIGADVTTGSIQAQVLARLRGGWLLTKRHGLAYSPLVAALAEDLGEQLAAGSERAGQVAGPRTSGYVMALLPLLGLALGAGMGADPVRVLLESAVGNVLLVVGVGLTCVGLLWSARIVRS
jgi:tight adherence protein B